MKVTVGLFAMLVACGGELTELDGIYEIQTWTANESSCAQEGDSIFDNESDRYFTISEEALLGIDYLLVTLCVDVASCRRQLEGTGFGSGSYGLDSGSDGSGWKGGGATAMSNLGSDDCSGQARDFLLTTSGGTVKFELTTTDVASFPAGDEGACWTEDARDAASGMPCTGYEVFTGVLVEEL